MIYNRRGRQRFWEMKGSAMGNAIGIVDDGHPEDATEAAKFDRPMADGEDGAEKHFGELLKAKNVARSDFSRSKTMQQQRQALPIFACKDSILRAVRENSVVVVEGETGSGKTTQLVQFMHEAGYTKLGKIGCTQVRRICFRRLITQTPHVYTAAPPSRRRHCRQESCGRDAV
jgi:pre-mRNA-splicing factor ATP-dependent RNA helicase DHX38/PRP16